MKIESAKDVDGLGGEKERDEGGTRQTSRIFAFRRRARAMQSRYGTKRGQNKS